MKKSTLCFCLKDDQVLLAMKKRGFGMGKWNGYGGKVEEGETPRVAAARELAEESGLLARGKDLKHVGLVRFYFDTTPIFECSVYLVRIWKNQAEAIETEEMSPKWYPVSSLPYEEMWAADARWIPLILDGESIEADVIFNADGSEVTDFSYKAVKFD